MTNLKKRQWLLDVIILSLSIGFFYALWLGAHALFTPDEGRYSEIAREMVISGDYITPRLNGVAFLDKPILYYWLQASSIYLFGAKEWSVRLWPLLIGILGCIMTYAAGFTLFNRRTAILSAIILASSPLFYGAAHYANLDLEVAVWISASLLTFLIGLKHRKILLLSYFFAAMAFLTKGLIGIAFPALIIGTWILLLNQWKLLTQIRLFLGLLLFTVIILPWYVLVQKANPQFLHFFFVTQQFSRFLSHNVYNNQTAMWFYIPILFAGFFPWSILIFQSIFYAIKNVWHNKNEHRHELFLLLWLVIVFVFFSIPKSKTIGYILPIFPTMALLLGIYLNNFWDQAKKFGIRVGIFIYLILCSIFAVGIMLLPHYFALHISTILIPYLQSSALLFLLSGFIIYFLSRKNSLLYLFIPMTITAILFLMIINLACIPLANQKSVKSLALAINQHWQPGNEVVTYYRYYQDLPMYLQKNDKITIVANWHAENIAEDDNWRRELWYGMPFQDTKEWLIDEKTFWQRWHSNKKLFVLVREDELAHFTKKSARPVYQLEKNSTVVVVTNVSE